MKLHERAIGYPPKTWNVCEEEIKKPDLEDLQRILQNNPIVNRLYYYGVHSGLSFEQTLIMIIQGLDSQQDSYQKQIMNLVSNKINPNPIIVEKK